MFTVQGAIFYMHMRMLPTFAMHMCNVINDVYFSF